MNKMHLAYDIDIDENGITRIDLYDVYVSNEIVNGIVNSKYVMEFKRSMYLLDFVEVGIMRLKERNYVSLQKFRHNFDIESDNILINLRLMLLRNHSKLLKKVYDDHCEIEGRSIIKKYIHYIDVDTGATYIMYVGSEDWNKDNICALENEGYINIADSNLLDMVHDLDAKNTLSRRIKCREKKN